MLGRRYQYVMGRVTSRGSNERSWDIPRHMILLSLRLKFVLNQDSSGQSYSAALGWGLCGHLQIRQRPGLLSQVGSGRPTMIWPRYMEMDSWRWFRMIQNVDKAGWQCCQAAVRELKPAKVSLQIRLNLHWPGPLRTLADKANIILSAGACSAPSAVSHVDISLYNRDAMVVKAEVALYLQVHTPSIRYLRLFTPSKNCLSINTYGIPDSDPELIHNVRLCDRLEKITWLNDQLYSSFLLERLFGSTIYWSL